MTTEQTDNAQEPTQQYDTPDQMQEGIQDTSDLEALQTEISTLKDSLKLERARTANALYEAEKTKERIERESDLAKKFALEKFTKELLDTVDNLERAIGAADAESPILEGVKLTHKALLTTLEKFAVLVVDTESGFNADFHQAVGIDPNAKAGTVGNVLQKGYTLNGRLLRPAMVLVGQ